MVKNNFKRPSNAFDTLERHQNELYKGAWENDMRHGHGICFYEDGSKYVGQWKENQRHGYGLHVSCDGEKSGGKWYNDNLVLMTRRNNIKLPMIKKKIKRSVMDAVEAADKAAKKTKLAITRGLAARKLAEEADGASRAAAVDAEKAQEFRRKYTLHPYLQGKNIQIWSPQWMSGNLMGRFYVQGTGETIYPPLQEFNQIQHFLQIKKYNTV